MKFPFHRHRGVVKKLLQEQTCRRGCTTYTPQQTAIGDEIFHYTTCACGTWYMTVDERKRFQAAQDRLYEHD